MRPEEVSVYDRGETRYSRCSCGGWFQNPMPTDESLAELYREAYRTISPDDPLRRFGGPRSSRVFPYLPREVGTMLDVGCSAGQLMGRAKASRWRVAGVEPNDKARECAARFGPVYPALEQVAGTFDLVTAIHVLEHVPDPVSFLRQMAGHLEPNGTLLVVVPHESYRPPHLLAMAEPQVRLLFERAGLTITFIETVATKTDTKSDIVVRAH